MADTPSPPADLSQIDFWLFDLDNTLYSPAAGLFRQVDERMGSYIMGIEDVDAARAVFIRDLRDDFGVNDEGVDLVLHLVDQLHGLRRMLSELRGELNAVRDGPRDAGG